MEINDKEWTKLFNSKERLCCAKCGAKKLNPYPTPMSGVTVSEAFMLKCWCGHERLELM